jgi:hypothetical protein
LGEIRTFQNFGRAQGASSPRCMVVGFAIPDEARDNWGKKNTQQRVLN